MTRYLEPIDNQTVTDLLRTVNMYAENTLGLVLILIIFSVLYFGLGLWTKEKGFATASLITALSAIFLRIIGILNDLALYMSIIVAVIGLIAIFRAD